MTKQSPMDTIDLILVFGIAPLHPALWWIVLLQWFLRRWLRFAVWTHDALVFMGLGRRVASAFTYAVMPSVRAFVSELRTQPVFDSEPVTEEITRNDDIDDEVAPEISASDNLIDVLTKLTHILVIGHTEGGKTSVIHELAVRWAQDHKVIVCDLDAAPGLWEGCTVFGYGDDYAQVTVGLQWLKFIIDARRDQRGKGKRDFELVHVIIDEAQDVVKGIPWARDLIEDGVRRGAKLGVRIVVGVQDRLVETLGLKGKSKVLNNLTEMELMLEGEGRRIAKLRGARVGAGYTMPVPSLPDIRQLVRVNAVADVDEDMLLLKAQEAVQVKPTAKSADPLIYIKVRVVPKEGSRIQGGELYRDYCVWAEEHGEQPINKTAFGLTLNKVEGLSKEKVGGYVYYHGVTLKSEVITDEGASSCGSVDGGD